MAWNLVSYLYIQQLVLRMTLNNYGMVAYCTQASIFLPEILLILEIIKNSISKYL